MEIMVITFRDINQDNFYECMRLSVRKDQPFVASNAFSVAESKIFPFWITKAIYADEQMVGFLMYDSLPDTFRLHQSEGNRDWRLLIEEIIEQSQAETK